MNHRLMLGAGGVLTAALIAAGTVSAAGEPPDRGALAFRQQATGTATPSATATSRPGGPPGDRPGNARPENQQGGRPEAPGQGNRPAGSATPGGGRPDARPGPQLPPQASPRARAAVEAAAKKHELLRDRLAAMKAIPRDADRAEAMKAVMADFGDLFHLVSDAVHSVDPSKGTPAATGTGTPRATGTSTATGTGTATGTATATSTPRP